MRHEDAPVRQRAADLLKEGRPAEAERLCADLCEHDPGDAHAWFLLGVARHLRESRDEALAAFGQALRLDSEKVQYASATGVVLLELGREQEAIVLYRDALARHPQEPQLLFNLGVALEQAGDFEGALRQYDLCLMRNPADQRALLNRGATLLRLNRPGEALANHDRLAAQYPELADAHFNRSEVLLALNRAHDALLAADRALLGNPNHVGARINRGLALSVLGRFDEAEAAFAAARKLDAQAFATHRFTLRGWNETTEDKFDPRAIFLRKGAERQEVCDWSGRGAFVADFESLVMSGLGTPREIGHRALGFISLGLPISPQSRLALARGITRRIEAKARQEQGERNFVHAPRQRDRLRIGYLSPDFRTHPSAFLTRRLYELHDRQGFEVYGYSLHPGDGSEVRRDIERGCDRFVELSDFSDRAAAETIHADGIDVLVDLAGYTRFRFSRTEIMAMRPAPVQVSWEYAGSMGANFIDYAIVDAVAIAHGQEKYWTEKLAYLPDNYLIYNNRERIAEGASGRAGLGLPEQGFVFCCLNNPYKIEPTVFDIWMRLLRRVPGAVLWLLAENAVVERNLRREAVIRGVAAERLVFARFVAHEQHLARYRHADLFLDTLWYNGHTTCADALWAGLPVLTCPGESFPSRVTASLLAAAGLPELIANNLDAYEALALKLARRPGELAHLRERLNANRNSHPLFDTERFVRHLERAYLTMWARHEAGLSPETFRVSPLQAEPGPSPRRG